MKDLKRTCCSVVNGLFGIVLSIMTIISSIIGVVGSGLLLVSNKLDEGIDFVGDQMSRLLDDLMKEREKPVEVEESDIETGSVVEEDISE